jgi:hypothetical protein
MAESAHVGRASSRHAVVCCSAWRALGEDARVVYCLSVVSLRALPPLPPLLQQGEGRAAAGQQLQSRLLEVQERCNCCLNSGSNSALDLLLVTNTTTLLIVVTRQQVVGVTGLMSSIRVTGLM